MPTSNRCVRFREHCFYGVISQQCNRIKKVSRSIGGSIFRSDTLAADRANPLAELANSTLGWLVRQSRDARADQSLVPTTGSLRISSELIASSVRHTGEVTALVALPDRHIASGAADGSVRVWDQGGHEPRVFHLHAGRILALAALPDGRIASSAIDGPVRVWDPEGRHEPLVFEGQTGGIRALVMLSDGRIASGANDGSVSSGIPEAAMSHSYSRYSGGVGH